MTLENAVALQEQPQNHLGFLNGQVHAVKRLIAGVGEHLAALDALIALAIFPFTELAAVDPAIVTGHWESS